MALHDKLSIGPYTLECVGFTQDSNANYNSEYALLDVYKGGKKQFQMTPEKRVYLASDSRRPWWPFTRFPSGILYVVYEGTNPDTGQPIIKAFLNPLVSWIWAGVVLMVFGTLVALVPSLKPAAAKRRPAMRRCFQRALRFGSRRAGAGAGRGRLLLAGRDGRRLALQRPEPPADVHLRLREMLGECNHVGCRTRAGTGRTARGHRQAGKSDQEILAVVRRQVRRHGAGRAHHHGFDLVAWIAPFAVFGAALLGTILLVRRWSVGKTQRKLQPPIRPWTRSGKRFAGRPIRQRRRVLSHD
jgi:hypothetical protein